MYIGLLTVTGECVVFWISLRGLCKGQGVYLDTLLQIKSFQQGYYRSLEAPLAKYYSAPTLM